LQRGDALLRRLADASQRRACLFQFRPQAAICCNSSPSVTCVPWPQQKRAAV
jgi:hypothetical protein